MVMNAKQEAGPLLNRVRSEDGQCNRKRRIYYSQVNIHTFIPKLVSFQHFAFWQPPLTGCDFSGNWMHAPVSLSKPQAGVSLKEKLMSGLGNLCYCLSNDRSSWKLLTARVKFSSELEETPLLQQSFVAQYVGVSVCGVSEHHLEDLEYNSSPLLSSVGVLSTHRWVYFCVRRWNPSLLWRRSWIMLPARWPRRPACLSEDVLTFIVTCPAQVRGSGRSSEHPDRFLSLKRTLSLSAQHEDEYEYICRSQKASVLSVLLEAEAIQGRQEIGAGFIFSLPLCFSFSLSC